MAQKLDAVGPQIPVIRIREVLTDVPKGRGSQQCVHNRMGQNVCIGVAQQPQRMGHFYAA